MDEMLFKRASGKRRVTDLVTGDLFSDAVPRRGRSYNAALDKTRLLTKTERVLLLLLDRRWHTLDELRAVGGSSGDRRLRDLRHLGFVVDAERDPSQAEASGAWRYCLRLIPAHQYEYVDRLTKHQPQVKRSATLGAQAYRVNPSLLSPDSTDE